MKFTDAQLAFLMTKMTIDDAFIAEAAAFKAKRKPRTKVEKVVVKVEICTKVKKNGQPCTYKVKTNGMCGKHAPKSVASVLSDEVVSEASSDASIDDLVASALSNEVVSEASSDASIDDLAESLSQTAIAEAMEVL
jgi:hypothetical protein